MIKKVLVGVDINIRSSMVVDYAASLCKVIGAELEAVHVIEELQVYSFFGSVSTLNKDEIRGEKKDILKETAKLSEKYGIKVSGRIVEAISPTEELLRIANEEGFDLIVVGSHGKSVLMEYILGGVSSQIVHHSKVPVLVVKNKRNFSRILMCTGGSTYAEDAIVYGADIAKRAESRVTVLSVAPTMVPEVVDQAWQFAERGVAILKDRGVDAEALVRTGDPAEEILTEAREFDYRLIVMGYKGTSAMVDLLLGDVVSKVMHHSRRPTLVFREDPSREQKVDQQ